MPNVVILLIAAVLLAGSIVLVYGSSRAMLDEEHAVADSMLLAIYLVGLALYFAVFVVAAVLLVQIL